MQHGILSEARIDLGDVTVSEGAAELLRRFGIRTETILRNHGSCHWGNIGETDARENDMVVLRGYGCVLSRIGLPYALAGNSPACWIHVVTDVGRPSTKVRLASEY